MDDDGDGRNFKSFEKLISFLKKEKKRFDDCLSLSMKFRLFDELANSKLHFTFFHAIHLHLTHLMTLFICFFLSVFFIFQFVGRSRKHIKISLSNVTDVNCLDN